MKPSFTNGQILSAEETEKLLGISKKNDGANPLSDTSVYDPAPAPAAAAVIEPEPKAEPKAVKAKTTFLATKKSFKVTLLPDHHRIAQVWADMKGISIDALLQDLLEKELEQRGKVGAARIDRPGWAPRQLISGPSGSVKVAAPEPAPAPAPVPEPTEPAESSAVDFDF